MCRNFLKSTDFILSLKRFSVSLPKSVRYRKTIPRANNSFSKEVLSSTSTVIYIEFVFTTIPALKINSRHVAILIPISILTFWSSSACHCASACQILSKSPPLSILPKCLYIFAPPIVALYSNIYPRTKFDANILIGDSHGRKTKSKMAAIRHLGFVIVPFWTTYDVPLNELNLPC